MNILIIEDDADIAINLRDGLVAKGHTVDAVADGAAGYRNALAHEYDAILLDLALPGMDGLSLCRRLREEARRDTPILMLTARDTLDDKLEGFARGADDYLVKPFALSEVEARLVALNRRHAGRVTGGELVVGDIHFDRETLAVTRGGVPVKLPPKCLRLLELLMQNPSRVFSRNDLETAVWGEVQPTSDTLRSHMHILRRALAVPGKPDPIENVHGLGYRLVKPDADPA